MNVKIPQLFGHFDSKQIQFFNIDLNTKFHTTTPNVIVLFLENVIFGMFRSVIGHDRGHHSHTTCVFLTTRQPPVGQELLIIQASR
jgi:hypothetical protein